MAAPLYRNAIPALVAGLAEAMDPIPVWFLVAPQQPDNEPPPLPLVIVSDSGSSDLAQTTCGNSSMLSTLVRIDAYAYTAEEAAQLGAEIHVLVPGIVGGASEDFAGMFYEPDARAWRATAEWSVSDGPATVAPLT